ncbi:hypothetical protein CsSME_00044903 [Camellia sinensis var. sinensis]
MEFLGYLVCSMVFLILIRGLALFRRRRTLPPGPTGLPLFGNLFEVGPKPHESLAKLAKTYGPLMTIRMGSRTSVVASSPEVAREILQKNDEACSGRIVPDAATGQKHHYLALVWISTVEQCRLIRRALSICLTNQQKLDTLRGLRHKAVGEMIQHVRETRDRSLAIGELAFITALNMMSNTCFSVNVAGFESGEAQGFLNAVKTIMVVDGKFNIADVFPWLKPLDPQGLRTKAKVAYGWLDDVCDGFITRRLKHRESNLLSYGDLLDSLLDYSQEHHESEFNCKNIKVLLGELLLAGTETSSNTVEWAMTELLLHPNIMSKLREEITKTIGPEGTIEESKIIALPYLHAVVKETMRLHLAVPLLIPHKTETDVKLRGFLIPKNTQIFVNAWAIARNPSYWENPTQFMPERFLRSEMDYKGQNFSFLPFGSGRRMCPGIPLAQRVVSLMIASLVYHFDWKLPEGVTPENLDMADTFGITLQRATPLRAIPVARRD